MRGSNPLLALIVAGATVLAACAGDDSGQQSADAVEAGQTEVAGAGGPFLLVVNKSSNTLSVVDPNSWEEVKSLPTGFAPHEVAVSGDRRFAYVTDYGTGEQPGNTITPVGVAPIGVLITPDNRTAYIANTQDDKITVIDLEKWEVTGEILTGDEPDGMAWTG